MDSETAYREMRRATAMSPDIAELQYELGIVAPLPEFACW